MPSNEIEGIFFQIFILFIQMKTILLFLSLLTMMSFFSKNEPLSIESIRLNYIKAVEDEDITEKMLEKITGEHLKNPLFLAYRGAFEGLMAKHVFNPYKKISYLSLSNKTLAQAIKQKPNNVEMRFLRFSMQHYVPDFLGQSKELKEDKNAIVKNIATDNELTQESQKVVCQFMLDCKRCTNEEVKMFKDLLK